MIAWPTVALFEPGDAAFDVTSDILTDGRTSRLRRRLVDELALARSVGAWQISRKQGGHLELEVLARPDVGLQKILDVVDEELATLAKNGPDDDELLQAVRSWEVSFLDGSETVSSRAARMHSYALHQGRPDMFADDLERYRKLTRSDVQRAARELISGKPRVVVSVVPAGEVKLAVAGSKPAPPAPPEPQESKKDDSGQRGSGRPAPAVAPPTTRAPPAVVVPVPNTRRLSSGWLVQHVPRSGTGLVDVRLVLPSGAIAEPVGKEGLAHLAASTAERGAGPAGSDTATAPGFEAALKRLGASLSVWAGWDALHLHLHAPADRVAPAVELMTLALAQPRFSQLEWDRLLLEEKADLARARDQPRSLLQLARQRALYGDKMRRGTRLRGTSASLAGISLEDARRFWARAVDPARSAILVAGDLDDEQVERALAPLGRLPRQSSPHQVTRPGRLPLDRPAVVVVHRERAVQSAIAVAGPWVERTPVLDAGLRTMNTLLGGSFTSRLNQNLREKNQYAYGASSFLVRMPKGSYLTVTSRVASGVTGPALVEVDRELDAIQRPASSEEIARARQYTLLTLPDDLETGRAIAAEMAWLYTEGASLDDLGGLAAALPTVDRAGVVRAARSVLVGRGRTRVIVGDLTVVRPQLEKAGLGPVVVVEPEALLGP